MFFPTGIFSYVEPIIVNTDLTIVGGHQRCKVLKELGYTEVDCVVIDIDKTKEKALNIALNKISGDWDMESLAKLLDELKERDFNIEFTGFDFSEAENYGMNLCQRMIRKRKMRFPMCRISR
ncbi:ParB-like nuclease domain-containing protein [Desulfotomaculum arcticum]|uniref:ParB-like nuclease domain-containing protein n=1 Tax=Desulfotruncus arcticus DSM 17038 TaxID=1121424 RepID=A0A1I2PNH7_9FIRM|nr:ParB N-terminal domain-containing protein [Desulfotruncus arcticus]SFG14991.1 ParB-like nuclease domain-containing protein [Desulfotomaculum arcticum] [Desulfotruncus arcticus DSM 17038]